MPTPFSLLVPSALPCPFCGSKAVAIASDGAHVSVNCTMCLTSGPACLARDKRATKASVQTDAVRCWNRAMRPLADERRHLYGEEAASAA